jgi:hypothetical protein
MDTDVYSQHGPIQNEQWGWPVNFGGFDGGLLAYTAQLIAEPGRPHKINQPFAHSVTVLLFLDAPFVLNVERAILALKRSSLVWTARYAAHHLNPRIRKCVRECGFVGCPYAIRIGVGHYTIRKMDFRHVYVLSTCTVYGNPAQIPACHMTGSSSTGRTQPGMVSGGWLVSSTHFLMSSVST